MAKRKPFSEKQRKKPFTLNRAMVLRAAGILAVIGLLTAGYLLFAHRIIHAMYDGRSVGFLNTLFGGKQYYPLEHYYSLGRRAFWGTVCLLLIIGSFFTLLPSAVFFHAIRRIVITVFINIIIVIVLFDGLIALIFAQPSLARFLPSQHALTTMYYLTAVSVPQADPHKSIYDPVVAYVLRPSSTFPFSNPEFSTTVHTNSLGLRDDEASLHRPRIICAGDSFTMGWGVEQNESFPQRIEQETGYLVLNAGVPSYGTAREMKLLERIDTTNTATIVLQYCQNDTAENKSFLENGNKIIVLPRKQQRAQQLKELNYRRIYYPGKYFFYALHVLTLRAIAITTDDPHSRVDVVCDSDRYCEADLFFNALMNANPGALDNKHVIILAEPYFITELETHRDMYRNALPSTTITLVTIPEKKDHPEYYYPIDGHFTAAGHAAIAARICRQLSPPDKT